MKDSYLHNQAEADRSIARIKQLLQEGVSQAEMVLILNRENYKTIRMKPWSWTNLRQVLHRLRQDLATWYGISKRRCGLDTSQL